MRGASVRVTALLAPLLGLLVALFWIGGASGLEIPTQADSLVRRTEEYECPSNCSNKGHCIMGKCYCLFGYSGDNCAIVSDVVALKPGGENLRTEEGHPRQPVGGSPVYQDAGPDGAPIGKPVGSVTSSTISPMRGGEPVCFAVVRTDFTDPGTELFVEAEGAMLSGEVREGLSFLG